MYDGRGLQEDNEKGKIKKFSFRNTSTSLWMGKVIDNIEHD